MSEATLQFVWVLHFRPCSGGKAGLGVAGQFKVALQIDDRTLFQHPPDLTTAQLESAHGEEGLLKGSNSKCYSTLRPTALHASKDTGQHKVMARQRKEKDVKVRFKHPDRSGPDPSRQTLFDIAGQRGLLKEEDEAGDKDVLIGRLGESILWSVSLTMLHFTLDVLVSHQYAIEIVWRELIMRAAQAFPSKALALFLRSY